MNSFENLKNDFRLFSKTKGISSDTLDRYMSNSPISSYIDPTVIETRSSNLAVISIYGRLLMDRTIFLGSEINDEVANIISAQLLWLDSTDPGKDITMMVASPGGSVYGGYEILDCMDYINSDVSTVCMGLVASMGAVIASSGKKGKRMILPRARFMIHQPMGGAHGQASDILINAKEIEKVRTELYKILSDNSNLSYKEIEKMADRDCYLNAEEALKHGFVDNIVKK